MPKNADAPTKEAARKNGGLRQEDIVHGADELPCVRVESYNLEIRDGKGYIGDRASGRAFRALLDKVQDEAGDMAEDALGDVRAAELKKKEWDRLLTEGDADQAAIIHSAVEEFSQNLAAVVRRYLDHKSWKKVSRVVVGGGLRRSRVGELAISRTEMILRGDGIEIDLTPLHHHPDAGGMIGCVQLLPRDAFEDYDSFIAVDIGGSNIRSGVVLLNRDRAKDFSAAKVAEWELWRHREDKPKRDEALDHLGGMLRLLVGHAEDRKLKLAPIIGIGCPGRIAEDGGIENGTQNLPGNWEAKGFHLPEAVRERMPYVSGEKTRVILHNDAVVQGLSEVSRMREVKHWGVLTIGTGLGNASFTTLE